MERNAQAITDSPAMMSDKRLLKLAAEMIVDYETEGCEFSYEECRSVIEELTLRMGAEL